MTGKLRYPVHIPKVPSYSLQPHAGWQTAMRDALRSELFRSGWLQRGATFAFWKDYLVQVYLHNWTLHFQISVDGEEFENEAYGDLTDKALICFDAEAGGRVSGSIINELQKEILAAVNGAGVKDRLGADLPPRAHHVVWETIDMPDRSDEAAQEAGARRLVEYIDAIYPVADPVLERLQGT